MTYQFEDGDEPSARLLLLVRHGATEWSTEARLTGRTDLPLSEAGRLECLRLHRFLEAKDLVDPGAVWCSPMLRAVETVDLVFPAKPTVVVDQLREVDYGLFEGSKRSSTSDPTAEWDYWSSGAPEGESPQSAIARADEVVSRWRFQPAGSATAIVAHGQILQAIAGRALGLGQTSFSVLRANSASVGVLVDGPSRGVFLTLWGAQ